MRLIDADALDDTFIRLNADNWQLTRGEHKRMESVLFEMPTIDAEPVRYGEWIPCTKKGMPITELGLRQGLKWYGFKCSECMAIYKGNALTESPYCQHCGARMEDEVVL